MVLAKKEISFKLNDQLTKDHILFWIASHPFAAFLDTCETNIDGYGEYDFLAASSSSSRSLIDPEKQPATLSGNWCFGFIPYDGTHQFFKPDVRIWRRNNEKECFIEAPDPEKILDEIKKISHPHEGLIYQNEFSSNFEIAEYLDTVSLIREHILEGEYYELNLCQEFLAGAELESPAATWKSLKEISPVPFASFFRFNHSYLLSASPERFLKKKSQKLITQPIKGTIRRSEEAAEDQQLKDQLYHSEKDRAENVMIVDLSRNDLYRSCQTNSVEVEHLFEIQSFSGIHHMVSTITGEISSEILPFQAIRNAFPPGSMTGAPKVKVMEMIQQLEPSQRGIYSGAAGYFNPDGDFDLNVVIRSIIYDSNSKRLSFHVGGAITWDSLPQPEYDETLLKAAAIRKVLKQD